MTTYVYAIVHATHPLRGESFHGVGDPPSPVRLLTEGDLGAVVSDTPEGLRAKRRDLIAHQNVLAELAASDSVLPMRFGSVSVDDDAVRGVLSECRVSFEERLRELDGKVEFNVKAAHHEEPLLRRILAEEQVIRELNERTRHTGSQQDRLHLGELVTNAVQERKTRDADLIRQALRPFAAVERSGPAMRDCLCNYSFLVDRTVIEDFRAAVDRLQQEQEHLEVNAHGPLPPYSFVEPAA